MGGSTAQQLDLADRITERLPLIIAVVVGLSMVLLLIAFRSAIAPLQAAFVNLLAVGAAYGIVTAVLSASKVSGNRSRPERDALLPAGTARLGL